MKAEILTKEGIKEIDLNRRKAIKLKCLDCSGFEYSEVKGCSHRQCSLWPFRFATGKQYPKERVQAIKAFCFYCCYDQTFEVSQCVSNNCPLYIFRGYNLSTIPEISQKTKQTSLLKHDFASVILEPHTKVKELNGRLYVNK